MKCSVVGCGLPPQTGLTFYADHHLTCANPAGLDLRVRIYLCPNHVVYTKKIEEKPLVNDEVTSVQKEAVRDEIEKGDLLVLRLPNTTVTVACLTMENGFSVIGHSACVDPANFDATIGEEIAMQRVNDKLWELLGFRLCDKLYNRD